MNDKSQMTLFAEVEKAAREITYIPVADKTISNFSTLVSQELYDTFDVPFVRGFSMLLRSVSSIQAKKLNEE